MTLCSARILQIIVLAALLMLARGAGIAQQTAITLTPSSYPTTNLNRVIESGAKLIAANGGYGISVSTDNGQTWTVSNTGLPIRFVNGSPVLPLVRSLYKFKSTIFAGTEYFGVWKSNDDAQTWEAASGDVLGDKTIFQLAANKNSLFALGHYILLGGGTTNSKIYRSSDSGQTWVETSGGILAGKSVSTLVTKGEILFALAQVILPDGSGAGLKMYRSLDSGQTWEEKINGIPIDSEKISQLLFLGNTLIAPTANKLYLSEDNGESWGIRTLPADSGNITSLSITGPIIFIATTSGASWRSGDKGQTWERLNGPNSSGIYANGNHVILYGNIDASGPLDPHRVLPYLYYSSNTGASFSGNLSPYSYGFPNQLFYATFRYNRIFVSVFTLGATFYQSNLLTPIATTVSAANYQLGSLASESVASVFGTGLALTTASATGGALPTSLENTSVTITDNAGNAKTAPLFYISPTQINFQLPSGLAKGVGTIAINLYNQIVATGVIAIANTAPGLFSANQSGTGLAAANVQRVKADGTSTYEPAVRFDSASQQFIALPINVNTGTDQAYLNLYGTGIRGRSDLVNVKATIGGIDVPVTYAGAHGFFVGVDQVNILLPSTLAGKGEVEIILTVDNQIANSVKISIQ